MPDLSFFDECTEQSAVKGAIVSKYFWAWANVITKKAKADQIAYLDLFAGPGRYKDGTKSTPIRVLQRAIEDPVLRERLVCVFNDKDEQNTRQLEEAIAGVDGIDTLSHKPIVWNNEVGDSIVRDFESMRLIPTLFFVDPWGYKGLSLRLVNSVIKDWACECVFFFNYTRINMGLSNALVADHIDALFGKKTADMLRSRLSAYASPYDRELAIVETLCDALGASTGRFVLPFAFRNESGSRTSHHLIFVTKHVLGYTIMKEIMARESSSSEQGVASFMYSPADKRFPVLFEYGQPLNVLQGRLMSEFVGRNVTVGEIFRRHHVGKPYIVRNYQDVIIGMDENCLVTTSRSERHRKLRQCPESITVNFME